MFAWLLAAPDCAVTSPKFFLAAEFATAALLAADEAAATLAVAGSATTLAKSTCVLASEAVLADCSALMKLEQ